MGRKSKIAIGIILTLVAVFLFLTKERHQPSNCSFTVDMPKVRALAASLPGAHPKEIRFEHLANFTFPEALVYTGGAWSGSKMDVYAYQLVFDDRTIIVDTAMNKSQTEKNHGEGFDDAAWEHLKQGMASASAIYVTHEHGDHMGGLVSELGTPSVAAAARFTKAQLAHPETLQIPIPANALAALKPIDYAGAVAVAPGVVLIAAPGHTPGSQLVYVQLADGKELLFLGDAAWHTENIDQLRAPPRLISLLLKNDRNETSCQLIAFHDLGEKEPKLHLVPGHDARVIHALVEQGVIAQGFK
jgi:glyoxylase-like metal-dependent hydrolase (beta-lactamase superfamily II)